MAKRSAHEQMKGQLSFAFMMLFISLGVAEIVGGIGTYIGSRFDIQGVIPKSIMDGIAYIAVGICLYQFLGSAWEKSKKATGQPKVKK